MSIGESIKTYFSGPGRLRRIILVSTAALVLVLLVVFNQSVGNLFRFLAGRAAEIPSWTLQGDVPSTNSRHLAKSIVATQNGHRYLFFIGGLTDDSKLSRSVARLEIDAEGKPLNGNTTWETNTTPGTWGQLYSYHAAMEAVVTQDGSGNDNYLYVIAGDIHIPFDPSLPNPLLFSTIERLNLQSATASWEPVVILSGINFYPEVAIFGDRLHIVGGVYGYPRDYFSVDFSGDEAKWNEKYKNLPIVTDGCPIGLKNGGGGDNIINGGTTVIPIPGGGTAVGLNDGQVHIAAAPDPNFAKIISDALKSGNFVTTVSEHYKVNLNNFSDFTAGELGAKASDAKPGNDYLGTLYDTWELGKVSHLGHLRFFTQVQVGVATEPYEHWPNVTRTYLVQPVPQGRYGHKLYVFDDHLYVVGGASWSGQIKRIYNQLVVTNGGPVVPGVVLLNTFWVIEDDSTAIDDTQNGVYIERKDVDPITFQQLFGDLKSTMFTVWPGFDYQYVGNIAYGWNGSTNKWAGTNPSTNSGNYLLDHKFAFSKGRAFFGFSQMKPSENSVAYMAVGGLENLVTPNVFGIGDYTYIDSSDPLHHYKEVPSLRWDRGSCANANFLDCRSGRFGITVGVSDQVDRLDETADGWKEDLTLPEAVYDISAVGLANESFVFGGDTKFQADSDQPFNNEHVPDSETSPSVNSFLYTSDAGGTYTWNTAGPLHVAASLYAANAVRTPISIVDGKPEGEIIFIYKISGANKTAVETTGPRSYGGHGILDPNHSTIKIMPFRDGFPADIAPPAYMDVGSQQDVPVVKADRYDYATVTVTLRDYYDQPLSSAEAAKYGVTLYTSRSPKPLVNRNIWDSYDPNVKDWVRFAGKPLDNHPIYPDKQFAVIDGSNNEDQNPDTTISQVQFRIGSAFNTFTNNNITPDTLGLMIGIVETTATTENDYIFSGVPGKDDGSNQMVFTSHGTPSLESKVVATSPVKPDGVDQSIVTATLLDIYDDPIPVKKIILESNRTWDTIAPQASYSDITTSTGEATFTAVSTKVGFAHVTGYCDNTYDYLHIQDVVPSHPAYIQDDPQQTLRQQKLAEKSDDIYFSDKGSIASLVPDFGYQGQTIATMVATAGKNTAWTNADTKVNFIRPTMSFFAGDKDNHPNYNLDNVAIIIDPAIPPQAKLLGVEVAPNEPVTVELIQSLGGSFYPVPGNPLQLTADGNGRVNFSYLPAQTAATKGILKIKATAGNSGKVGYLWLPVRQSTNTLEVIVKPNPASVGDPGAQGQSVVTVGAYSNGTLITNLTNVTFSFEKDDPDGTLQARTDPLLKNIADYARLTDASGPVGVFATITYGGQTQVGRATITKLPVSGGDPNAKITYNPNDLHVDEPNQILTINGQGVYIPTAAEVGSWIFQTLTNIGSGASADTLVETYPFSVRPAGYEQGPYLKPIIPSSGFLGSTVNPIHIEGVNLTFNWSGANKSVITFTSYTYPGQTLTANIVAGNNDATNLYVSLDIPMDANPGFWDVKVTTPGNPDVVAEQSGHMDFLVTTPTGYLLRLGANPHSIPRVLGNKSALTSTLSFINPYNGVLYPVSDIDTTFTLESNNGGSLKDELPHKTNANGIATNEYTTDNGDTTVVALVKATADLSSLDITDEVSSTVDIERTANNIPPVDNNPDCAGSTISAQSPVPANGTSFSVVIVTVRNASGDPIQDVPVGLATSLGVIDDNSETSNVDGQAVFQVSSSNQGTATVTADVNSLCNLTASIRFEDPSLLSAYHLKITVPFQNKDYDNLVMLKFKDQTHTGAGYTNYSEVFKKNAHTGTPPDLLLLKHPERPTEDLVFYLYTDGTKYTVWVKGKNNLAKSIADLTAAAVTPPSIGDFTVDFGPLTNSHGLTIGDVTTTSGSTPLPGGFHDNKINADDMLAVVSHWFSKTADLFDLNNDGVVDTGDFWYIFISYGTSGANQP